MKKQFLVLATLCVLLASCEKKAEKSADNTGRNARDRNGNTLTTGDQSETGEDLATTQKIRSALVDDDSLSTNAKNVKIITVNGVVTLRGLVNSDREKSDVARIARSAATVRSLDNQLEISRQGEPREETTMRTDRPTNSR